MKVPFCLPVLLIATLSTNAWAQHRGAHVAPHGGGAVHPGMTQPVRAMTPQQQQQMVMEQRYWAEFFGLNRSGRPQGGGRTQPRSNASQAGSRRNHPAGSQRPSGPNAGTIEPQKRAADPAKAKAKTQERVQDTTKRQAAKSAAIHKNAARKAATSTRLPLAADQRTIGLLHTAHNKLREADHDYAGHRVRAMENISAALGHLHPTLNLGSFDGFGTGNLPQSQSDQILRDAIVKLQIAQSSMPSSANRAAHHESAHRSVTEAIRELHIALNIR